MQFSIYLVHIVFQESLLFKLDTALNKIGINVDSMHSEYTPGQFELACQPKFGLETMDETFILREAVSA